MSALAKDELIDGKYRIVRFLGKGAWASVYEGVNIRLHRRVAIKVLGKETLQHPGVVERFEREGQAATQIESDHVIDIFDIGSLEDGRPYMVMEFLDGEDLGKVFEKAGVLPPERAVFYAVQALTGLAAAHGAGVLHRDIKPANVVLVKKQDQEIVKIVDFGISKLHSGAVPQPTAMTQTNAVLGSPVYMSPEQCRGARLMDHRSDLYSLGVVLYEALTGKVPHIADSFNALMFKIALEDVPDPRTHRADLDEDLVAVIMKALTRDAEKRYQSAVEFRNALIQWADTHGFDPGQWSVGSVRSLAVSKSGAAPKGDVVVDGEDGKSTRMLTDSGERRTGGGTGDASGPALGSGPAVAKGVGLTDSQSKASGNGVADPALSSSRPTDTSAAAPNRTPIYAGIAAVAVVAIVAIFATRKPDAPTPDPSKTGIVMTATPTEKASSGAATASATNAAAPTGATATETAAATASAAPTTSGASSAAPTQATAAQATTARATGVAITAKPPLSASAKATATAPAASASAKATVDGRTIHTNF